MDVQTIIDTAMAASSTTLGAAEAASAYRMALSSAIKVEVNLTPGQKCLLQKMVAFPLVFTGGKSITNDHPLLVAVRDIVRHAYEAEFHISRSAERVLVVGASMREISMYRINPHIHYHIYGKEAKDYDRVVRPALQTISRDLKKKASKSDRRVFMMPDEGGGDGPMRPAVKKYYEFEQVFRDYMNLNKMPANIHTDYIAAETLVFEDSWYNLTPVAWVDLFDRTGAKVAYGYGLLPMELLFDDLPENPVYSVTKHSDGTTSLTFRHGYCTGYVHDTDAWATLLRYPVLISKVSKTKLAVEITSRAGPAVVFKVYRVTHSERIVRSIELPPEEAYVKVLDVHASCNRRTGKVNKPLFYVSVREEEYIDTYNYCLSLDKKSLTFPNVVSYIRRRMGGMSLITRELVKPWFLPRRHVQTLALTVLLAVRLAHDERETIEDNIGVGSVWEKFAAAFRVAGRRAMMPVMCFIDWLRAGHLVDRLVLYPDGRVFQNVIVHVDKEDSGVSEMDLYTDWPYEGDIPDCPVCLLMMGKMGEQKVTCMHVDDNFVELKLTDEQLKKLHTDLIDNDGDPPGLKSVKDRCAAAMPKSGFSVNVRVNYIEAGPGCGKSYLIRQLADETDLVLAPFTKLRPDYLDLTNSDGQKYDLNFKTTHRAMETRGAKRIFVDEFTSMPYEFLACIAEVNGAQEVYLVGDVKQTKVIEPDEGLYIGNYIQLDKVSIHRLNVNFRNPKDTVAMLNRVYGYKMEAFSNIDRSVEFVTVADLPKLEKATRMAFSKMSSKMQTETEANTVRANQGGTTKIAVLYCTANDGNLPSVEELQIVGLSRHTEKLYIVTDGCEQAEMFKKKIDLTPEFYDHMTTWLVPPDEPIKTMQLVDVCVETVLRPVQPPRDMYKLVNTFVPTAAQDDIQTSLNLEGSHLVEEHFATGKFHPDLLIMPVNKRGHPSKTEETYYSVGSGVGNHFSAGKPVQTLQVLQARYFNKQAYFAFGSSQQRLIRSIISEWFGNHVRSGFKNDLFQDNEIQEVINRFLQHVTQRNYQAQFAASGGLDNDQGRVIRFQLKGIFKPKHGEPDVKKAGQGISAWATDACAMFCSVFRLLTTMVAKTEAQHVVTDSYIDESQFIDRTNAAFNAVSKLALNATTDGVTFDANQNTFTQNLEKAYWREYGVADEFLDHYYSFRKDYRVVSTVAMGYAGTQKTSGEPGTLVNNGVVSKLISNYMVEGEGPCVINYKGDDFNKRQLNLRLNEKRKADIDGACALKLRVSIGESAEFCGLLFSEGTLFPSIPRKVNKIHAHRFRNYAHWCEYQCSLRDWVSRVDKYGEMQVVAHNSAHYKTSYEEMQAAYDCIKSFSHIDEDQWKESFVRRSEPSLIPVRRSTGAIAFVE